MEKNDGKLDGPRVKRKKTVFCTQYADSGKDRKIAERVKNNLTRHNNTIDDSIQTKTKKCSNLTACSPNNESLFIRSGFCDLSRSGFSHRKLDKK